MSAKLCQPLPALSGLPTACRPQIDLDEAVSTGGLDPQGLRKDRIWFYWESGQISYMQLYQVEGIFSRSENKTNLK